MNAINNELFLSAIERYPWRNTQPNSRGRLIASSPFGDRADNTPSFSVVIDPDAEAFGCWNDAGAVDPYWARGSPIKLYAFLRNITLQEAFEELTGGDVEDKPTLRVRLNAPEPELIRRPIDMTPYIQREVPYLTGRNIAPVIQRLYRCGFDSERNAVVMPWTSPIGTFLNAKWRSTYGKQFWYARGGAPVKSMIFGVDIAHRRCIKRAVITEAEIDAMTAASAGTFGLAVGGSEFTDEKAELLRRSPIEELLIAGDNDAAGEKLRWQIERKMRGYMRLYNVEINDAKDFNAAGIEATREACANATQLLTVRPRLLIR
ncbi:toprim domain-containing protein [Paenibacillus sp. FSL K6-2859]|uniref:toprim domain-containing protein n=1 Tax=Paenibacillus sp. FSL K6-2859 TaxID=2921482 RepID=UPI0030F813BA